MGRPWMPFYIGDYLRDTQHLTLAQHGAYMFLIWHYWEHGGLPKTDAEVCQIARVSRRNWARFKATLVPFFVMPGWHHKRIDAELQKYEKGRQQKVLAGLASGNARSAKRAKMAQKAGHSGRTAVGQPFERPDSKKEREESSFLVESHRVQRGLVEGADTTAVQQASEGPSSLATALPGGRAPSLGEDPAASVPPDRLNASSSVGLSNGHMTASAALVSVLKAKGWT
jgi:uncharacterized protein YdaU (DUF1376 family)